MAVIFTPAAEADLSDIWKYSVDRWGVDQAEQYLKELSLVCSKLSSSVHQAVAADYIKSGYYKSLAGKHLVFFTRHGNEVTVVRILHQRMDFTKTL